MRYTYIRFHNYAEFLLLQLHTTHYSIVKYLSFLLQQSSRRKNVFISVLLSFAASCYCLKNIRECVFSQQQRTKPFFTGSSTTIRRCAHFNLFTLAGNINNNQELGASTPDLAKEKVFYTTMMQDVYTAPHRKINSIPGSFLLFSLCRHSFRAPAAIKVSLSQMNDGPMNARSVLQEDPSLLFDKQLILVLK